MTVRVKDWVASEPTPLLAVMVSGKLPGAEAVPERVAVPSPLSVNVTPAGSEPDSLIEAVGLPVEVTVKVPADPVVKVVLAPLVMAGAASTVRVKDWVASEPTPLLAVMVIGNEPLDVGVPASVAVPSPLSTRVTPAGSEPVSVMAAVGSPVEVTVKVPADPVVKVVLAPLVMAGAASTVSVNDWVASEPTPLLAVMVIGKLPGAEAVPESVAVPSPLSVNVTPAGSEPVSVMAAVGSPVEVTVKVPADPVVKVVLEPLVMAGAAWTVQVNEVEPA